MSLVSSTSASSISAAVKPRLHVGLTFSNTLVSVSGSGQYTLRPHLRYFASMLERNRCDVTLFSPFPETLQESRLRKFRAAFPVHHRVVSRCDDMAEYASVLVAVCESAHCDAKRILLIDSAMTAKFYTQQTLIIERYVPQRRLRGEQRALAAALASEKQVAATAEDMVLVAAADMISEMAAAPSSTVTDYLRLEPLVEKVRVPTFGEAFFLPNENCDHIEMVPQLRTESK